MPQSFEVAEHATKHAHSIHLKQVVSLFLLTLPFTLVSELTWKMVRNVRFSPVSDSDFVQVPFVTVCKWRLDKVMLTRCSRPRQTPSSCKASRPSPARSSRLSVTVRISIAQADVCTDPYGQTRVIYHLTCSARSCATRCAGPGVLPLPSHVPAQVEHIIQSLPERCVAREAKRAQVDLTGPLQTLVIPERRRAWASALAAQPDLTTVMTYMTTGEAKRPTRTTGTGWSVHGW